MEQEGGSFQSSLQRLHRLGALTRKRQQDSTIDPPHSPHRSILQESIIRQVKEQSIPSYRQEERCLSRKIGEGTNVPSIFKKSPYLKKSMLMDNQAACIQEEEEEEPHLGNYKSVSSTRGLYKNRREKEEARLLEKWRQAKEKKEKEDKARAFKEKEKQLLKKEPAFVSLEAELRGSRSAYVVMNDITFKKICGDVIFKVELIRETRACLGDGKAVLLRASVMDQKDGHECRQALLCCYMACIDRVEGAAPYINYDGSCKCFEVVLKPRERKSIFI